MKTFKVSWNEFKDAVSNLTHTARGIVYRGPSDASWGLVSSYHRLAAAVASSVYWALLDEVKDYVETWSDHSWDLSAAQGTDCAQRNKDIVEERMTRKQIAEAQRMSREWIEAHPPGGN